YLFPRMQALQREHGGPVARWLKRRNERALNWVLDHGRGVLSLAAIAVLCAAVSMPFLPRSFLPEFNEGNIYVTLLMHPDISLQESFRIGHMGDRILAQIPEVVRMQRRSGRYEAD